MRVSDPATYDGNFHATQKDADEFPEPLRTTNYGSSRIFIAANFINTLQLASPLKVLLTKRLSCVFFFFFHGSLALRVSLLIHVSL
jgi:hypothetical protein